MSTKIGKKEKGKKKYWELKGIILFVTFLIIIFILGTYKIQSIQETFNIFSLSSYIGIDSSNSDSSYQNSYGSTTFQVTIGMLVATQTISITIFVFLKSLLDSKKEEQRYSKGTMDIYIRQMTFFLIFLTALSLILLGYGFLFYNGRFYMDYSNQKEVFMGWLIPLALFEILTFYFWERCISNNKYWKKIVLTEKWNVGVDINKVLDSKFKEYIVDSNEQVENSSDFISLFSQIEELLMCGVDCQFDIFNNNEERIQNHLKQSGTFPQISIEIEKGDLQHDDNFKHIANVRKCVYQNKEDVVRLYQCLKIYRDLLLLEQFDIRPMQEKVSNSMQKGISIFNSFVLNSYIKNIVFHNVIFEALTFQFADLYGTKIIDSVLTGVKFEKSIVARLQVEKSNMNMGLYQDMQFLNVGFRNNSLVNSKFERIQIINSEFSNNQLNNSEFIHCKIIASSFERSDLSDMEFDDVCLDKINFSGAVLKNLHLKNCTKIKNCNFEGTEISGWTIEESARVFSNQNFSKANLDFLVLKDEDASSDIFSQASMYRCNFQKNDMQHCIFESTDLTESVFQTINFEASIFKKANLHKAEITGCIFSFCDLERASITAAIIEKSTFTETDCSYLDLTQTHISNSIFKNAMLNKASLMNCTISDTSFNGMYGEDMTFHSSEVEKCNFKNAIFKCANIKVVTFYQCDFEGAIFENVIVDEVIFKKCNLKNVNWINKSHIRNIKIIKCSGLKRRIK